MKHLVTPARERAAQLHRKGVARVVVDEDAHRLSEAVAFAAAPTIEAVPCRDKHRRRLGIGRASVARRSRPLYFSGSPHHDGDKDTRTHDLWHLALGIRVRPP